MNLHQKILIILTFILAIGGPVKAQFSEIGKPFIENYSPKIYKHENQNFSITQDTNGVMYFGNLDGVMQFDGQSWRLMPFKGRPFLTRTDNGKIFVGGYKTFGEIINTPDYKMEYKPCSDQIWKDGYEFDHVDKVLNFGNKVLVLAQPHVFVIDERNRVEHILTNSKPIRIYGTTEPLLLLDTGLFKINLQTLDTVACSCSDYKSVNNILPFKNKYLVQFKDKSWKILDQDFNFIRDFSNNDNSFLSNSKFKDGIYLSNGMFAFRTETCGLIILNEKGEFVTHINQNNGLIDSDINDIYEDSHHNLWLAMNNGLSFLNYPAVVTIFDKDYGIKGGVYDIIRFNNQLFIATSQGLLMSPESTSISDNCNATQFDKIEGITQKCRRFLKVKERLFVTSKDGIYEIIDQQVHKVSKRYALSLTNSREFKDYIYVATQNGLFIYDVSKGFELVGKLKNLDKSIRTVSETIEGDLWLGTNYEGVYFVDMPEEFSLNPKIINYKEEKGLPEDHSWIDVFTTHKGTYFSSFKGVFKFDTSKDKFVKQFLIDSVQERWYYPISEDNQGNLWFSSGIAKEYHRQTGLRYYLSEKDSFITVTQPFNNIRDYSIEVIYPDDNSVVWFGSAEGLLRFDGKKKNRNTINFSTDIRLVKIGTDSLIDPNIANHKKKLKVLFKDNSLFFQVCSSQYLPQDEVLFQFKLEGRDKDWTEWSTSYTKQYSGLKEGNYKLLVRSKNIQEIITEPTAFSFIIQPPFYRTWWAYSSYFVLILSFLYMLYRYRAYLYAKEKNDLEMIIREKTEEIVMQKERAEDLVKNILPEDTARELQTKGRASRRKYEMVTVLFSDIQGFTEIAEGLNPERLLDEFDQYVMQFDKVVEKYNIEKIKTIGDAYMCAGGIPKMNRTNPIDVVLAGLQMIEFANKVQEESEFNWGIRFGIHTGPVIAGVVGSKKMSYDIWGDTVNVASRMESYGKIGQLNISEVTYNLVSSYFECEFRGKIPVKYKGNVSMYFVKGLKAKYAIENSLTTPNREFELMLQNIRFETLEDLILTKLEKGLDKRLYYHNVKHTIDVINSVEIIGKGEGVSDEEMILLKTAALFHDLGHTISFIDHEEQGIIFAKDILSDYNYSPEQIEVISELIYATKFPPEPRNKLEEIICDADLDYLGRPDFIYSSQNLYMEMFEHGRINNKAEWDEIQISFLNTHQYYTKTAQEAREVNKQEQLKILLESVGKSHGKK